MGLVGDIGKIIDVILAFNKETEYEQILNIILTKIMEITHADGGTLYLLEDGMLHFGIVKNISMNITTSDAINMPPIRLDANNIENACAFCALENKPVVIEDVYESGMFNFSGPREWDKNTGYRTKSMIVLPLSTYWNEESEVLGVIQLINSPYLDIFNPPIVPALANIAANTLANLAHLKEIRMLFHSFVEVMATTIDERSAHSHRHTRQVADYCVKFAKYLNKEHSGDTRFIFTKQRIEELHMAAVLHDIGKIVTPLEIMDKADRLTERLPILRYRFEIKKNQLEIDMLKGIISPKIYEEEIAALAQTLQFVENLSFSSVLSDEQLAEISALQSLTFRDAQGKTTALLEPQDIEALSIRKGTLTEGERAVMQEHAVVTGRLLESIAFWKYYKNVPEWARNHHELLDGSGYPRNLKGSKLSLESRLITMMDIFEALTATDRPYKKAMSPEKAFDVLSEMSKAGKIDGELVELFKKSRICSL